MANLVVPSLMYGYEKDELRCSAHYVTETNTGNRLKALVKPSVGILYGRNRPVTWPISSYQTNDKLHHRDLDIALVVEQLRAHRFGEALDGVLGSTKSTRVSPAKSPCNSSARTCPSRLQASAIPLPHRASVPGADSQISV